MNLTEQQKKEIRRWHSESMRTAEEILAAMPGAVSALQGIDLQNLCKRYSITFREYYQIITGEGKEK